MNDWEKEFDLYWGVCPEGTPKYEAREKAKVFIRETLASQMNMSDQTPSEELISEFISESKKWIEQWEDKTLPCIYCGIKPVSMMLIVELLEAREQALTQVCLDERKKVIEEVEENLPQKRVIKIGHPPNTSHENYGFNQCLEEIKEQINKLKEPNQP